MSAHLLSLKDRYPRHAGVPVLILASIVLLGFGWNLPLMIVEKSVLWQHWQNTYSVITGIIGLYHDQEYILALIIFVFSVIFPLVKLTALLVIWMVQLPDEQRRMILRWLELLGKWSMLDVFVVAIIVVAAKLKTLTTVTPQVGVYIFGLSVALSMITTTYVESLAHRAFRGRASD